MLVLVVDDEESICELLALMLEEKYEVLKAYNGKEALLIIKQQPVALVITDIMMPYMDGMELLEALKTNPATQHIPVILTSAADFPKNEVLRAEAYLTKPFDLDLVQQTVSQLLSPQTGSESSNQTPFPGPYLKLESESPSNGTPSSNSSINPPFQSIADHSFFRKNFPPI
jgi:CheY-like chemotaxis protein